MTYRNPGSAFIRRGLNASWLAGDVLRLLDIGASGGLHHFWNQFRPRLQALGVDPLIAEIERLNAEETDPAIRYEAAWVGTGRPVDFPPGSHTLFSLSSARRAQDATRRSYVQAVFNSGAPLAYAERHVTVDELVRSALPDPDVLKIDVDFFEAFVLDGATDTLRDGGLLLIECECVMQELIGAPWRCFSDIDRLLRAAGFRLLDFSPFRYTRGALPAPFAFDMQAQTTAGQILFCDAVWFQDPSVDAAALERLRSRPGKLAKLVLLLEGYGFPDIAAAILLALKEQGCVPPGLDADTALDWLVPDNPFGASTHAAYLAAFDADPGRFEPARWNAAGLEHRVAAMAPVPRALDGAEWRPAYDEARVGRVAGGTRIVTAPLAWSYAAEMRVNPEALGAEEFVIELSATVSGGIAYATLASPKLDRIGDQVKLGVGTHRIHLAGRAGDGRTHILLRNGEGKTATEIVVSGVRCLR